MRIEPCYAWSLFISEYFPNVECCISQQKTLLVLHTFTVLILSREEECVQSECITFSSLLEMKTSLHLSGGFDSFFFFSFTHFNDLKQMISPVRQSGRVVFACNLCRFVFFLPSPNALYEYSNHIECCSSQRFWFSVYFYYYWYHSIMLAAVAACAAHFWYGYGAADNCSGSMHLESVSLAAAEWTAVVRYRIIKIQYFCCCCFVRISNRD